MRTLLSALWGHSADEPLVATLGPTRWIVRTDCHECFVDVACEPNKNFAFVEVSLLSTHHGFWKRGLRARCKRNISSAPVMGLGSLNASWAAVGGILATNPPIA